MPTARELLEQADALMRRHRGSAPEAPPPSRVPPLVSPRTIQHEPIAPSVARTSLPVDPTESPALASDVQEQPVPAAQPPAAEPVADIPLLTDAVPVGDAEDMDDVPLLTDAVEEIEFPAVEETPDEEPSLWVDTEQGGDAGVPAPTPEAPSPGALEPPQSAPPGRDPLGLDRPAPGFEPMPLSVAELADEPPFGEVPQSEIETELRETDHEPAPVAAPSTETSSDEPARAFGTETEEPSPSLSQESSEEPAISSFEEAIFAEAIFEPVPAHTEDATPEPAAPNEASGAVIAPLDEARIREIAEEISMQVLQRIDIFADTGLRAQLGERLKPAVDRASVELVSAINQHVGELLRVFVAEAVEREIEQWRDRQQR